MNIIGSHVYSLVLRSNSPRVRAAVKLIRSAAEAVKNGPRSFTKPMTERGHKLYMVGFTNRTVIYVGEATSGMATKLNRGLNAKGQHGYHGYKWRSLRCPLRIAVWAFDASTKRSEVEAIEAEVTFLVRLQSGEWPSHQNEIHFQWQTTKRHRLLARRIIYEWDG
jgi:hypothetical protein